jgi:hypothetical protein
MVPRIHFACTRHWFRLPEELRSRIWKAYRAGDWAKHRELRKEAAAIWRKEMSA